jgi:DNA-binding transcriptional LysR family regulator
MSMLVYPVDMAPEPDRRVSTDRANFTTALFSGAIQQNPFVVADTGVSLHVSGESWRVNLELRHLRSFVVLADELHFTRAAQKLHIVQPALTAQINALEVEIGGKLFERDKRTVRLTEIGQLFLMQAKATLEQAARAMQVAQGAGRGELGTLRIGFVSTAIKVILPHMIRRLHECFPRLQLEFYDMNTPRQLTALRDGHIDFGFVRMPAAAKGIHVKVISEESFVVVLPQQHPLANCEIIRLESLEEEPMLSLARRAAPGYSDALLGALSEQHFIPHIVQEFDELSTMVGMVSSGLGLAIVPTSVALAHPPGVVACALDLPGCRSQIGVAWKDSRSRLGEKVLSLLDEISTQSPPEKKDHSASKKNSMLKRSKSGKTRN